MTLPSSIESALVGAGFSATEIVILKRLLEEDALTLREIAARTGKSTGVLDQAMKKLLRKGIVSKEDINDTTKFAIHSLQSIVKWMENHTRSQREELLRRHQNFETFIASLEKGKHRPDMEFFDGKEGMQQAYTKLLDRGKELLIYDPVFCSIEDHPLRDFFVQYFRDRRRRGIFSRIIAHATPLGRRFQSRDPFEYRKSLLIPEQDLPITFEKIIAGDTVACFNHAEQRACFIHYPELAATERGMFEAIWRKGSVPEGEMSGAPGPEREEVKVPFSVKFLSGLREFFLSRKSIATFIAFALVAAGITYGLQRYTANLNLQRIRDQAKSIAATAALQFDVKDLETLRTFQDVARPEYAKVIGQLNKIRDQNPLVKFAYIMRPVPGQEYFAFVADADSLALKARKDLNRDGFIDDRDHLSPPGEKYNESTDKLKDALSFPQADEAPVTDQWATIIAGLAPIQDQSGKTAAVIGVDVLVENWDALNKVSFNAIYSFVGLFLLFVFIRLAAFNKSLFEEIWMVFKLRKVLVTVGICAEIAFFITLFLYLHTLKIMKEEIGTRLMSIAATAASEFDPKDLEQLHIAGDMKKEAYQRVFTKLNAIRDGNPSISYAYIMRQTADPFVWEFVADADSNYYIPQVGSDINQDLVLDEADENVAPGVQYFLKENANEKFFSGKPAYSEDFLIDQWGRFLDGTAPIFDQDHRLISVLGISQYVSDEFELIRKHFTPILWFLVLFTAFLMIRILSFR
ncbi:MAG: hypothetical protein Greene041619_899 [Candidatus Peregrinibacteria bacterium Greene0416_19]|nr:MAG: hypothetical protein Greene041619_899 [Candidatus Peregrinibacteria bacterium Greene0416_19]